MCSKSDMLSSAGESGVTVSRSNATGSVSHDTMCIAWFALTGLKKLTQRCPDLLYIEITVFQINPCAQAQRFRHGVVRKTMLSAELRVRIQGNQQAKDPQPDAGSDVIYGLQTRRKCGNGMNDLFYECKDHCLARVRQ
jgi:hypothetical protein